MPKKWLIVLVLIMGITLLSMGCAHLPVGQGEQIASEVMQSEKQRVTSPDVEDADLTALVEGNSAFAFDLYQMLKETEDNFFYSPYSISLALAMTYSGARSETANQMVDTLHFPKSNLHAIFNSLDIELAQRGEGAQGRDGEGFRLNIINAIWGQKGFEFLVSFLDSLAEHYGAGLRILDFTNEPEESRTAINDWVSDQTEDRIKDLIPQGVIDSLTRLVLTNAIYFNAAWQYPFQEHATHDGSFYLLSGDEIIVPMMRKTESLGYIADDGYQVIELPYDGGEFSMVILLPSLGQFETFEGLLNEQWAKEIFEKLERQQVALTMPKFEFESEFSLKKVLIAMGMPAAFSLEADFSGMTGNRDLFIADVIHKAFVAVDEAGTEAAAATAVVMKETAMPAAPIEVKIDRPFIFLIRDIKTGTILFVGRVVNPS